ncbi:helix-turn-helix domain-containing protein [Enterobacter hormaechei]|uniref:helix-turn-helix domain-containing protein n=1 Tax=Enterobacter hormaechei TaxID=158836 RepID=UPI001F09267D|nr:hypothetical protein [Enterobacter hormaechei]
MSDSYKEKTVEDQKNRDRFFVTHRINRFGERLKSAMEAKGISSNVKMGEMCGMSDTVIRNYLIGKTYPTLDRLSTLAYVVDRSPAWLLSGIDDVSETRPELEHKSEAGNNYHANQEGGVLQMLNETQKALLSDAILNYGVSGIISALNGMSAIDEFLRIPESDRERVLRLYKQIKEGDSEGDQEPAPGDPLANHQRAG